MSSLYALNNLRWYGRLPIKWAIFGLTLLVVCFPYPRRLILHLQHLRDPNALIEPDAPAIQPFVEELRPRLTENLPPRDVLNLVERFVKKKIPYEWDWNTWGTADYLPTVTEVIEMGKEDCDGRAVVAASLLRNFGFDAQLVTDFSHVWVKTDQGETMGPGKNKVIIATDRGLRINFKALAELPKALAFGVAVFPFPRELIVLVVMWLLLLRRRGGVLCSLGGLALFLLGLEFLRAGGENYYAPTLWLQWAGFAGLVAGFATLLFWGGRNARNAAMVEAQFTSEDGPIDKRM